MLVTVSAHGLKSEVYSSITFFGSRNKERGIFMCGGFKTRYIQAQHACFGSWIKERGIFYINVSCRYWNNYQIS